MAEIHPVAPRPAAAIVLMRTGQPGRLEVFMVRRHVQSDFVPNVYVFPGGSVKAEDRETIAGNPGVTTTGPQPRREIGRHPGSR